MAIKDYPWCFIPIRRTTVYSLFGIAPLMPHTRFELFFAELIGTSERGKEDITKVKRPTHYNYHVQREFSGFWERFGSSRRNVLFVFGLGFDPPCVPELKKVSETFVDDCYVSTVCARFTNLWDGRLRQNAEHSREWWAAARE